MRTLGRLLLCCLFPLAAWGGDAYRGADSNLLVQVRADFEAATESAAATTALMELLDQRLPSQETEWPPVFLAYRAALEGLAGKHSPRPWQKFSRTRAGLTRFEGLVEAHPESTEILLLRFSFCSQLPDFFDMQEQAARDRRALIQLLASPRDPMVDDTYRRDSMRWILRNGKPTPAEQKQLEEMLAGKTREGER